MPAASWTRRGNIAVAIVAALVLLVLANYLASKYWVQWDWTASRIHSISEKTQGTLDALQTPVRIISFLSDRQQPEVDSVLREVRTLIDGYHSRNPKYVVAELVDYNRDPLRAQDLLKQYKIDPWRDSLDLIVVSQGERTKLLRLDDLVEFDQERGQQGVPMVRAIRAEEALTGAILSVTRQRRPKLVFATGHGERDPRESREDGLGQLTAELEHGDIEIENWNAFAATAVPAGTDVLFITGPQTVWLAGEVAAVDAYLQHGGRVVLLLEPSLPRNANVMMPTGFESLLSRWGIGIHADIVIDRDNGVPFLGPETFSASLLALHPVTRSIDKGRVLFTLARSLSIDAPPPEVVVNTLSESSSTAWGETAIDKLSAVANDTADTRAPLGLLLAAEHKASTKDQRPARLIVSGDADVASNMFMGSASNRDFWLNAIAWLLDEQQTLGIAPKDRALTRMFVTEEDKTRLFFVLVLGLPALTIATGLLVWWTRRRGATR